MIGQAWRFRGLSSKPARKLASPSKKASARRAGASQAAGAAPTLRYGPAGDSASPRLRLKPRLVWPKGSLSPRARSHGPTRVAPLGLYYGSEVEIEGRQLHVVEGRTLTVITKPRYCFEALQQQMLHLNGRGFNKLGMSYRVIPWREASLDRHSARHRNGRGRLRRSSQARG